MIIGLILIWAAGAWMGYALSDARRRRELNWVRNDAQVKVLDSYFQGLEEANGNTNR